MGMKYLLCFVLFALPVYASDTNLIIEDALDNLTTLISKVEGIKTIAINEFEYSKDIEIRNVEEKVSWKIAKSGKFKVIERKSLGVLLNEQKLSLAGLTEESSEMKKIGSIIGVDAFLFGKVNTSGTKLVINLSLKEVATGAILWNEEFKGEDPSAASFGLGVRVGTYSADSKTFVSAGGNKEFLNLQDKSQGTWVAFLFHYVQRMQFSKGFSFGADAIFSRGDFQLERFEESIYSNSYDLLASSKFVDYNLSLIPIIRFHPMKFFGMAHDMIVIYGGAGISSDYIELNGTYRLKNKSGTEDSGEISYNSGMKLNPSAGFAFKYGIEVRFSDNFSMFFEGYNLPEMIMKFDVTTSIVPEFRVKRGSYYGFGAKYYFFSL